MALPAIPACTARVDDAVHVPGLTDAGVHFVVVSHLEKTYMDGAKLMAGNNPVIALTLRYDRIDSSGSHSFTSWRIMPGFRNLTT